MTFEFASLLGFLGLVGLPVLIHLINLLRHRRIKWAAMEFLLQSQKRNRTWVLLKQLLLLLLRMAAVAGVVLMVAEPKLRSSVGSLFGGVKTHHIVLLDDSFSMSDHWADTSAFRQAVAAVGRLGGQISQQGGRQEFTLLLFSEASRRGQGMKATLTHEPVTRDFKQILNDRLQNLQPSELAVGPSEGLAAIGQMVREGNESTSIVYLVSDFRANQWENTAELRKSLLELNAAGAQIQLVDCVDTARPNLALSALRPEMGVRAAGVTLKMGVSVTNYSPGTVHDVPIQLEEDGLARPAVTIHSIPAGQTAAADFEVRFPVAGQHRISAKLPADAVLADNNRYTVLDFLPTVPVLIVDGDPRAGGTAHGDAYFLSLALGSTPAAPTGLRPEVQPPRFLREKPLTPFHAIYLVNVDRLDQAEIDALEGYVKAGGGVAFFLGERTQPEFFNSRLYRDGQGLFPIPLVGPTELLLDRLETSADVTAESDHPVFSVFANQDNSDIDRVIVERYIAAQKNWTPPPNSATKVVARLRNNAPLIVERKFGDGRVIAYLTTAAPTWNNLARTPRHIFALLHLTAYLSTARQVDPSRQVGEPLEVEFDPARYQRQVKFITPLAGAAGMFPVDASLAKGETFKAALPANTDLSGVYEVQLTTTDNHVESRRFAYNVLPEEGNLRTVDGPRLAAGLGGVRYQFHAANDAFFETQDPHSLYLSRTLLYVLIGLLVCEQALAYSTSYHPGKERAR